MQRSRFNVVTDGQWGSCGKGLITSAIAWKRQPEVLSTTNMANAGHTAVNVDGRKFIAKALPSAAILTDWYPEYKPLIAVGPSAAFDLKQMLYEIEVCKTQNSTYIHPRAGVITEDHKSCESGSQGTKHIASTMQGCGAFLADKVMRRPDLKLAKDYIEISELTDNTKILSKRGIGGELSFPRTMHVIMDQGGTILHEGSQGFSLDIHHGSHYPQCTSRSTTALQNAADMGVNHKHIGDIYLVIRPYPIRVGNVIEDGKMVGYSGDHYDDQHEMTWAEVAQAAGAPPEVMQGELTTVTKRLRRVFSFSAKQLKEAVAINGATKLALNFANYIDWTCFGVSDYQQLPQTVIKYIHEIEDIAGIPVTIVGTGPQIDHVCFLEF